MSLDSSFVTIDVVYWCITDWRHVILRREVDFSPENHGPTALNYSPEGGLLPTLEQRAARIAIVDALDQVGVAKQQQAQTAAPHQRVLVHNTLPTVEYACQSLHHPCRWEGREG